MINVREREREREGDESLKDEMKEKKKEKGIQSSYVLFCFVFFNDIVGF